MNSAIGSNIDIQQIKRMPNMSDQAYKAMILFIGHFLRLAPIDDGLTFGNFNLHRSK